MKRVNTLLLKSGWAAATGLARLQVIPEPRPPDDPGSGLNRLLVILLRSPIGFDRKDGMTTRPGSIEHAA